MPDPGHDMTSMIAYCGLDCGKCDAHMATVNDDRELLRRTAESWSRLNGVTIMPEDIRRLGCRGDGPRPDFCEKHCRVRPCASERGFATCGECSEMDDCPKIGAIIASTPQVLEILKG